MYVTSLYGFRFHFIPNFFELNLHKYYTSEKKQYTYQCLCLLQEHQVLLSGTPLQNNTEELHSLLSFLEPERFKSTQAFLTEFGELKTDSQVEKLKAVRDCTMLYFTISCVI